MKICLDAGHGGKDPGAMAKDLLEKDINLDVARKLKGMLEDLGHKVIMTRDIDVDTGLTERAFIANESGCELFVSIHANAASNKQANGFETFHYEGNKEGEELATAIQSVTEFFTSRNNRGAKGNKSFVVLKKTKMTAVLVELGFITNDIEKKLLESDAYRYLLANCIADAVERVY